jgi:quercetin dioxygenase-like cupin family protein
MIRGWFVGDFAPSALRTSTCEAAVRTYRMGDVEAKHLHRIATEVTLVLHGQARMFDQTFGSGDIVVAEPGDATAFEALTDCTIVVVKTPSCADDKYHC